MNDEDARLVITYIQDTIEVETLKTVERKIENLASKVDLANTKAEIIKWMFIFWVAQFGAMFGIFYFFSVNRLPPSFLFCLVANSNKMAVNNYKLAILKKTFLFPTL